MKVLRKTVIFILVMTMILTLKSATQVNIFASPVLNSNYRKIANVAVIFTRLDDPFMMRLQESLQNIEKDAQNNVKFALFDGKNNISIQNEIIDSALRNNYDYMILNLADKRENIITDIINKFKEKNTPVILMNISPEVVARVSNLYEKVAFVLPDSKQAGTSEGKIIVDLWKTSKDRIDRNGDDILQYVLLKGRVNDPQAIDRTKYVLSTINDAGIKTQEIALIDANWSKELAESAIDNLFLKYNGSIEAIIANNDAMAIGAIEALQKYGYNNGEQSKNVTVVGIDGLPESIALVDKGFMTGTVIQDPNVAAQMFYTIGTNFINNQSPTQNTNYKTVNGEIIIPYPYDIYSRKPSPSTP